MTVLPSEPNPVNFAVVPRRTWKAGTLSYTATGLVILFCWLFWGDFAWSMKERTVTQVFPLILKKFSASDTLLAALMGVLPMIISMVLTPIVAYKSDRHRGRWGRRIPFLLIPTPIAVLAMLGLAFSPALGVGLHKLLGAESPGLDLSTLIFLGFFWVVFELATIVANSVLGGLINDVVPTEFLGRFYGVFRALSLIAGIIFNYWLFGKAEEAFTWIFIGMGSLYGVGFSMMCMKVKEGEYPPPPPAAEKQDLRGFLLGARDYFRKCFGIRYYWWIYANAALAATSFLPFNLFNVFYAKSLGMDNSTYGNYIALTYGISLFLAYPLGLLADRFHPFRIVLIVQTIYVVTTLAGGFYAVDQWNFGLALLIHGIMSGAYFTASASLGLRLLPRANFAQFASAAGIVSSLLGILVSFVVGRILDYSDHMYRYTFFMSGCISAAGLMVAFILYRKFVALGGPGNYRAPE